MAAAPTRRLVLALLGPGLAACTAQGPRYVPGAITAAAGKGLIYVYRPLGSLGTRGESPFVTIDGKSHGALDSGSFIATPVREGEIAVTVQQSLLMLIPTIPRTITVTVVAGGTSYVRVDQKIVRTDFERGATVSQAIEIAEVPSLEAQEELAETRRNR